MAATAVVTSPVVARGAGLLRAGDGMLRLGVRRAGQQAPAASALESATDIWLRRQRRGGKLGGLGCKRGR